MVVVGHSVLVPLVREADVYAARYHARELARRLGFDAYAATEVETAVAELASNVLRYGVEGLARLRALPDRFEVECADRGPGFRGGGAPPRRDGLGVGLQGAARLLDRLELGDLPGGGGRVWGVRYRVPPARAGDPPAGAAAARCAARPRTAGGAGGEGDWRVHAVVRPAPGQVECGDGVAVRADGEALWLAVADGLGHGPEAARAAEAVLGCLARAGEEGPAAVLAAAHAAARPTRGAAALVVRWSAREGLARYAGAGNVSGRVVPGGEALVPQPGGLGVHLPAPREAEVAVGPGQALLLWTDGVDPRELPPAAPPDEPGALAAWLEDLVLHWGLARDDALLVAAQRCA